MKKLGIIGYGALGKILCEGIRAHLPEDYRITGILEQADVLKEEIRTAGYRACDSFEELVDAHADDEFYRRLAALTVKVMEQ